MDNQSEGGHNPGSLAAVRSYLKYHNWAFESRSLRKNRHIHEIYSKPSAEGNWVCRVILETVDKR